MSAEPARLAADALGVSPRAVCLNCGTPLGEGAYCATCGQHVVEGRLTVAHLVSEFSSHVFALDRGLWFTARAVVRDPGGVAKRYLAGERRRYVSPIAFLSFAAAVALLALHFVAIGDLDRIRAQVQPLAAMTGGAITLSQANAFADFLYAVAQQEMLASIGLAILYALTVRALFRRTGVNLAEAGVLSLYAFADACLLYAALVPAIWLAGGNEQLRQLGTFVVYVVVVVHSARRFFDRRIGTAVRALVCFGLSFLVFTVLLYAGGLTYVVLTVPR